VLQQGELGRVPGDVAVRESDSAGRAEVKGARLLVAFAAIFLLYQASEGLQTRLAPGHPAGPALMLAAFLAAWPLGRWLGWRGYDAYGLRLRDGWAALLGAGLLLAMLAKLAALAAGLGAGAYALVPAAAAAPGLLDIAGTALVTFVPSVNEDILTRGFLLVAIPAWLARRGRSAPGFWSYVLLSAALYTANHLWRFDAGWSEQFRLFFLGLAYGAAAWRWRSLWGAVALHWGWNFSNALAGAFLGVETVDGEIGRFVSAAAHLALFLIVLLLPSGHSQVRFPKAAIGA
jgi:uncharacterized protein